MRKIFTTALLMLVTVLWAQEPIELPLWPEKMPNSNGLTGKQEDLFGGRVANVTHPSIYVYPASKPNGKAIIMCPGGGYARLAMNHEGHDMAQWFNSQGITYIVLKYRMPNGHHTVPITDAEQAIRLVRKHASEWKVNPQCIGIMGASAGGHLAASLATLYSSKETRPDFQILLYPVITMTEQTHGGSKKNLLGSQSTDELVKKYSLEMQVNSQTPPAFITLSSDDKTVPPANAINYYSALLLHQIPASLHVYPIGGHGWGFRDTFPYKRQWTDELEKWLREGILSAE